MTAPDAALAQLRRDSKREPFIRIEHIHKTFGQIPVLRDVSLDVARGELFTLLGPSGSGKTTLLRILAGFEAPCAGSVWIDGVDLTRIPPWRRPVNMMFQSYALFPHMSVEQNVGFGLRQEGLPRRQIARRVRDMIALVRLTGLERRKPDQLSGGQRQRVALARALIKQPKVLLLDEPLAALDRRLREDMQFELMRIQDTLGVTFVIVTHDQEEAMTLSTRIGIMNEGRLLQVGTPEQVYEFPVNRAVAGFLGSVNLFAGRVLEITPTHIRLGSDELGCAVLAEPVPGLAEGAECAIAIRPEKIEVHHRLPLGRVADVNAVQGRVNEVAYMGMLSIYQVDLPSGRMVRVSQPNPRRREGNAPRCDDPVWLNWDSANAMVLVS